MKTKMKPSINQRIGEFVREQRRAKEYAQKILDVIYARSEDLEREIASELLSAGYSRENPFYAKGGQLVCPSNDGGSLAVYVEDRGW